MNIIGIYKITSPSGKIYIGKSIHINIRKNDYSSKDKCKTQPRLFNSIKKYGWDKHIMEIIEICTVDNLSERERHWQDFYDVLGENGLNCMLTLTSDKSGNLHPDTKRKMSESKKGLNNKTAIATVCTLTGKEWHSAQMCAEENGIVPNTLIYKLLGKNTNDTPYIYKKNLHLKDTMCNQTVRGFKGKNNPMFGKSGKDAPSSKAVICNLTGKTWDTILECAIENGINHITLGGWLRGTSPNKSTFKFLADV